MKKIDFKKYKDFDWIVVGCVLIIFLGGLLLLYSSTYPENVDFVIRQVSWFFISACAFIAIVNINYRKIVGFGVIFYIASLIFLCLVLVFGSRRLGAQRWISIGGFSIQPSEFAKLFVTLCLVHYLAMHKSYRRVKDLVIPFVIVLVPFVLIMKEPDLGTALMFIPVLLALLYVWGMPLKHLIFIIATGAVLSPLGWHLLKDYQKERLLVFINPGIDPLGAGYTVIQSRIAIGSGQFLGKGWLSGTQNQLNFLSERHTDFIFSVAGEEWGFIGCMVLLCFYYLLIRRAFLIAERADNPAGRLLATAIGVMIGIQVVVNTAMTMGFMPVVGLPLPLVSYGGSSLLVTMISLGLLENVAINR